MNIITKIENRQNMKKLILIISFLRLLPLNSQMVINTSQNPSQIIVHPIAIDFVPGTSVTPADNTSLFEAKIYGYTAGQSQPSKSINGDQNYIKTTIYRGAYLANPLVSISYFDGLGKAMQAIQLRQSTSGMDIIAPFLYDNYGRKNKEYLPYASSSSSLEFRDNALSEVTNFYNQPLFENTANPYSEKSMENAPMESVLKLAAPGNPWAMGSGHEVKMDYLTNDANEVRIYKINSSWSAPLGYYEISWLESGANYYPENSLVKNVQKDENWTSGNDHTTVEYKNKNGRTVLKRSYNEGESYDTYYVYDPFGNLSVVIPPKANGDVQASALYGLCFLYRYDQKDRLVEKKMPGKAWEYLVYDKLDRLVASGPVYSPFRDQAGQKGWIIQKYDALNREVYSLWYPSYTNRLALQVSYDNATVFHEKSTNSVIDWVITGYSNQVFPTSGTSLLSVNYYDNYTFPNAPLLLTGQVEGQAISPLTKTLSTGSWVRVPTISTERLAEQSYTFYDEKARPIRTFMTNHLGGYTQKDLQLDFMGKTLKTVTKHKRIISSLDLMIVDFFSYNAQDQLETHTQQIGSNAPQLITKYIYDELGKMVAKKIGGTDVTGAGALQKIDYSYNIRGWLKKINDPNNLSPSPDEHDLFAYKLNYESVDNTLGGIVSPLYNGNISEAYWKSSSDNVMRKYGYQYDALSRLKIAKYQKPGTTIPVPNSYDEAMTYDKAGNILTMYRNTGLYEESQSPGTNPLFETIDNLEYTYSSTNPNQLIKVLDKSGHNLGFKETADIGVSVVNGTRQDTTNDYLYDEFGNMTQDLNKNIQQIKYNHLNLPIDIIMDNNKHIVYEYNAHGDKTTKLVYDGTSTTPIRTDYLEGFQYLNTQLDFFSHEEGYIKQNSGTYSYVYHLLDHLGNVRMSFKQGANGLEVMQENHYYPFGLKHEGYATSNLQPSYLYRYNGKEYQQEFGLNQYDYGARFYMADIGRWGVVDPLAHKLPSYSPYSAMANNPIMFFDPDGAFPYTFHIRAFAPPGAFKGTGFHDDNRGFSTSMSATSRIKQNFTIDPTKQTFTGGAPTNDPTIWNGASLTASDKGGASASFGKNSFGSATAGISANFEGSNPFFAGAAPDIEVSSAISITENLKTNQVFVALDISSKQFPATEGLMQDNAGNTLLLAGAAAYGSAGNLVNADKKKAATVDLIIGINNKGVFQNVTMGGKTYTLEEFNKLGTAKPAGPLPREDKDKGGN